MRRREDHELEARLVAALSEGALATSPPVTRDAQRAGASEARPLRGEALRRALADQCASDPKREVWPDHWFAPCDRAEATALRRMWARALYIGVVDWIDEVLRDVKRRALRGDKRPAPLPRWIDSPDFREVADHAGMDRDRAMDLSAHLMGLGRNNDIEELNRIRLALMHATAKEVEI